MVHVGEEEGGGIANLVSVCAARIVGFDWGCLRDREMVMHVWTREAVTEVPEGFRAFKEQPGREGFRGRPGASEVGGKGMDDSSSRLEA